MFSPSSIFLLLSLLNVQPLTPTPIDKVSLVAEDLSYVSKSSAMRLRAEDLAKIAAESEYLSQSLDVVVAVGFDFEHKDIEAGECPILQKIDGTWHIVAHTPCEPMPGPSPSAASFGNSRASATK